MSLLCFDALCRYPPCYIPPLARIIAVASQSDLDQGGIFRQTVRTYLGPSVGWVDVPQQWILPITTVGTTVVARGTNLVTINVNGNVTINLPSSRATPQGPQAIPRQWALIPIVIVDIGGFAGTNTYLINPNGSETIDGLSQLNLSAPYGVFVLLPKLTTGGWNLSQ